MKTRLLRIVWIVSLSWLGLLIYGGTFGTAQGQLTLNLIVFGWPAFFGLIGCYVLNGALGWPQDKNTPNQITKELIPEVPVTDSPRESEEDFLYEIEKSKNALKRNLEDSKNRMLEKWRLESSDDLERIEKTKEIILRSEVIPSALKIIKETYHWSSWINNQNGEWKYDDWIFERVKLPVNQRGDELALPELMPSTGEINESTYKLESCFGFIDENRKHITLFIYKYISSYLNGLGRLLIKVDGQLVIDIKVHQDSEEYSKWNCYNSTFYDSIEFCKPDIWISSIVNLGIEFDGQHEIARAKEQIEIEKHQINVNLNPKNNL